MKTDEQRRARELRAEGQSVKAIERQLGVSRSSVSRWVRDVRLGVNTSSAAVTWHASGARRTQPAVQTIYGSIQEYGGFDRPEWLD